jgi:hypothetical protein
MPFYHAVAVLSGDRRKTFENRTEDQVFSELVLPFVANGVITARWGGKKQSYQVLELRIYRTKKNWHRPTGPLDEFVKGKKNLFQRFEARANEVLGAGRARVFIVMPIQGEKHGNQEEQRIFREYDERFEAIEKVVAAFGCVAIRIDKEHPLEDLVSRIKQEIRGAAFVIADMTDERPSCYFEAGFAEGLPRPVIYVASKQSVVKPGTSTKIHFDIHMNVHFFVNHKELKGKLKDAIEKNRKRLIPEPKVSAARTLMDVLS